MLSHRTRPPLFEAACGYCLTHLRHQAQIVVQVMYGVQPIGKKFTADVEVAQVCAREAAACIATAIRIERAGVFGVCAVLYVEGAARGEQWSRCGRFS